MAAVTNIRLIARLDIKGSNLIKGFQFEGLRVVGDPHTYASRYYHEGVDEILYIDTVATLYGRSQLLDIVARTAEHVFVPITIGGGVRSVEDANALFRAGADKVAINSAALADPTLLSRLAEQFGAQAVVLSIQAKRTGNGEWVCYSENARERSIRGVVAWAVEAVERGAGEILLTSVDRDGTGLGFDLDLIQATADAISVPLIASGGLGAPEHLIEAVTAGASAVASGYALHFGKCTLGVLRNHALAHQLPVRQHVARPAA